MTTNPDNPRIRLTEDTASAEPDPASRHIPIGRHTDDPAANAHHSADIADMMAERSRGSADRSAASAETALNALRLAEVAADKALLAAARPPYVIRSEHATADKILAVIGIIAIAAITEILCVIAIYVVVRPVVATIDTLEHTPKTGRKTAPPPIGFAAAPDQPAGARS